MKFKNYRNPHTNNNIIYSKSDISDMRVRDVFKKAKEISTPAEHRPNKIFLTLNDNENLARSILHATILKPQIYRLGFSPLQ